MTDARKQSLYFPKDTLLEIVEEADRLERSLSWIIQKAWEVAKPTIQRIPAQLPETSEVE